MLTTPRLARPVCISSPSRKGGDCRTRRWIGHAARNSENHELHVLRPWNWRPLSNLGPCQVVEKLLRAVAIAILTERVRHESSCSRRGRRPVVWQR